MLAPVVHECEIGVGFGSEDFCAAQGTGCAPVFRVDAGSPRVERAESFARLIPQSVNRSVRLPGHGSSLGDAAVFTRAADEAVEAGAAADEVGGGAAEEQVVFRTAEEDVDVVAAGEVIVPVAALETVASRASYGFASVIDGNEIDEDTQWRKLELVARVADRAWPR